MLLMLLKAEFFAAQIVLSPHNKPQKRKKPPFGRLLCGVLWCEEMVAGVGFEPTTFRL